MLFLQIIASLQRKHRFCVHGTVLHINPKHIPGLVAMGNLLFSTGHSRQAIKYYNKALKFNPKDVHALTGLANTYYDLNKTHEAIN